MGTTPAPTISFIIPTRPGEQPSVALDSIQRLRYPAELTEVLVVEGSNPSAQRNAAISRSSGEILYFLDDDTALSPLAVRRALECLEEGGDPDLVCVGGPMMTARSDGPFQKAVGAAMGSVFGLGPVRNRHVPYGPMRRAGEMELMGANLAIRRAAFDRLGGFDESLYPSEENELLKRLQANGMQCAYHPLMTGRRSRRRSLAGVFRQNFTYGARRMSHIFANARPVDYVLFAPLALILVAALALIWPGLITLLPLLLYFSVGFAAALFAALMMKPALRTLLSLLLIFPTMHLAYGLGSAWGLLCRLIRPSRREGAGSRGVTGVKGVEIVKVLGQPQGGCPASRLAS